MANLLSSLWRHFYTPTTKDQQATTPTASGGSAFAGAAGGNLYGNAWMTSGLSADSTLEAGMSQDDLRQRARDVYRNSDVGGAIETRVDLVVGTGFTLQSRIVEEPGLITREQAKRYNREVETAIEEWSHSADIDRVTSLWEITRLIERHNCFDGESIIVLSDTENPDSDCTLAVQVIDPDRLRTPPGKITDPLCRLGVQKNAAGRVVGYWIQDQHPGDTLDVGQNFTFIPAGRVVHVYEKWFAGQSRGLPWLTRALLRIVNGNDLDEAGLIKAQVEACYVGYRKKSDKNPLTPEQLANATATRTVNGQRQQAMYPGTIEVLENDEDMVFGNPPRGDNTALLLQEQNYRRMAGALNMAYEMLARDWRGVSFAGGRLILSGVKVDTRSRQRRMREKPLRRIYKALILRMVSCRATSIPLESYALNPAIYERHRWVAQAWQYAISPREEIETAVIACDNNLQSKSDTIAELFGNDSETVFDDREEERALEREKQIVPPSLAKADSLSPADAETAQAKGSA